MGNEKIRSLIIDDDQFILDLLRDKLNQCLPEVEVLATAGSGQEGLEQILEYRPNLIFLDVEMADMTGFEMLTRVEHISFQVIFITSYNHYAIKAIRFNALDYLVKPIDLGELRQAIRRYKEQTKHPAQTEKVKDALHNFRTKAVADHKLVLHTHDGELRMVIKDIIRLEGERNYSYIYLNNHRKKLVSKTLADLEEMLRDKGFFRCHRSYLVNADHIRAYPTSNNLILSDGTDVPISRRKKEEFRNWWEKWGNE